MFSGIQREPLFRDQSAGNTLALFAIACTILISLLAIGWTLAPLIFPTAPNARYPVQFELSDLTPDKSGSSAKPSEARPSIDVRQSDEVVGDTQRSSSQPGIARRAPGNVLPLDFDLDAPSSSTNRYNANDGSLETTLPLLVDGVSAGNARIRIEDDARIMIAAGSVAEALGGKSAALPDRLASMIANRRGYISFNELRAGGVLVEYDPATDRVALTMPG